MMLRKLRDKLHGDAAVMRDRAGAFNSEIGRLKRLLSCHLTDEKDLVVPVI